MTDTSRRAANRATAYRWMMRIGAVLALIIFAATSTLAFIQTQRFENTRVAFGVQRTDAETAAKTAATEYQALSSQYANLFDACRKSPTCLASAPSEQAPVIIQGVPGAPGRSVTSEEIIAALQAYCNEHNACIGTAGIAGPAGAAGATGQDGTNGAPGAIGAAGAAGAAGATGADGRGILSIVCVQTATPTKTAFEFTFTDGTKIDVVGQCTPPLPAVPAAG